MSTEHELNFSHRPVMLDECIDNLAIKPDGIYVDGTAGGGGHSFAIASRLTTGRLIAIDQDEAAIAAASARLAPLGERAVVYRSNFRNIAQVCGELGVDGIDGLLLDLGVSSYQLDTPERGFSYNYDAPLDMRMNPDAPVSAYHIINETPFEELRRIISLHGEERFAGKIASAIVKRREQKPIETTLELVDVIKSAMPAAAKKEKQHPAKRTFQALRIHTNMELRAVETAVADALDCLNPGGRCAVISFHSLEDRIVKQGMADAAKGCTCPPNFPVCVCGKKPKVKLISRKPITSTEEELERNPRARSAKLRVCEKI